MATQLSLDLTTAECTEPSYFIDDRKCLTFRTYARILISRAAFQCLIFGKDIDGRVTGDSAMARNFKVVVTNSDNTTIETTEVSYFGAAFHFSFRVNTTGQYKVFITYLNDELPKGKCIRAVFIFQVN